MLITESTERAVVLTDTPDFTIYILYIERRSYSNEYRSMTRIASIGIIDLLTEDLLLAILL